MRFFIFVFLLALPALAQEETAANPNPMLSEGVWTLAAAVVTATAPIAWALIRNHLASRLDWKYRIVMDAIAYGVGRAWDDTGKVWKERAEAEGRKLSAGEAAELRKIATSEARAYARENGVEHHPILEKEELAEPLINQAVVDAKVQVEAARPRMRAGGRRVPA